MSNKINVILAYANLITKIEKSIYIVFNVINKTESLKIKIYNLLLYLKKIILNLLLKKNIFQFNKNDMHLIKNWILNHSLNFNNSNVYSNINKKGFYLYKKTNNIQDMLMLEPKINGIVYIKNSKIIYILNEDNIILYHNNKYILDEIIKDIVEYLNNNIVIPVTTSSSNEIKKIYNPKVYSYEIIYKEDEKIYSWKLENTIYENVKLFFSKKDNDKLLTPFENFFNNKNLYYNIGLNYKIISCFSGNPGLGKTTTVKYLAQKYSRDIYIFKNLEMSPDIFLNLFNEIPNDVIILFDDFDKLTNHDLSSFIVIILNILDGVLTKHGSVIIFCLNNDKFMERNFPTSTRTGRIDLNCNFNNFDKIEVENIIKNIYLEYKDVEIEEYVKLLKEKNIEIKISELKNNCLLASGKLNIAIDNLKN